MRVFHWDAFALLSQHFLRQSVALHFHADQVWGWQVNHAAVNERLHNAWLRPFAHHPAKYAGIQPHVTPFVSFAVRGLGGDGMDKPPRHALQAVDAHCPLLALFAGQGAAVALRGGFQLGQPMDPVQDWRVGRRPGMKRLLWVAQERTEDSLRRFFKSLGEARRSIRFVCSDMWRPYLNVIAEELEQAVHVLDRFHIMKKMNEAVDEVRRSEAARLRRDGYEAVLKHSRWCLLKRPENRTEKETVKLKELLQYNLQTVRSLLQKEDFQRFWEYTSPHWAVKFLDQWCARTMRSKIAPMKKVARSLREHRDLILNWFRAKGEISAGSVEGLNNKAKLTLRKAYGFQTYEAFEIALFHTLGNLPEPNFTHEFC